MLLALDTASRMISLALHDGSQVCYEATWHSANNHTIELSPAIDRALALNSLQPTALTAVAVAQGPGSFTGLRIGMGVAKGLALALDIALVTMPTLAIVAAGVPPFDGTLITVLQAGRGRICAQRFHHLDGTDWIPAGQAEILSWAELLERITARTLVAGEISEQGHAAIAHTPAPVVIAPGSVALRRAGYLAELAYRRLRAGDTDDPRTLTPIYLHQPGVPHP